MKLEERARQDIDRQLTEAGWVVQDAAAAYVRLTSQLLVASGGLVPSGRA